MGKINSKYESCTAIVRAIGPRATITKNPTRIIRVNTVRIIQLRQLKVKKVETLSLTIKILI